MILDQVTSPEFLDLLIRCGLFMVVGCIGMVAHYLNMVFRNTSTSTSKEYFFSFNFPATLYAVAGLFATMTAYITAGTIQEASLVSLLVMAATTGYSSDSLLNSDKTESKTTDIGSSEIAGSPPSVDDSDSG